eukprot:gene6796-7562_t
MADYQDDSSNDSNGREYSEGGLNLAGFLFGNIDEKGELENSEVLDEESKKHLSQLASLGALGSLVDDISSENKHPLPSDFSSQDGYVKSDVAAIDYSTIEELADENEKYVQIGLEAFQGTSKDEDDYDEEDEEDEEDEAPKKKASLNLPKVPLFSEASSVTTPDNAMRLPSVVPSAETSKSEEEHQGSEALADMFSPSSPPQEPALQAKDLKSQPSSHSESHGKSIEQIIKSKEDTDSQAVFSGIIEKSDPKTVTELFPDFRHGKALRFSRLFGPKKYVSAQWKGLKKRRKKKRIYSSDGDSIGKVGEKGFRCKTPPLARPEDCQIDDAVRMLEDIPIELYAPAHLIQKRQKNEVTEDDKEKQIVNCEWRYGPAEYWYNYYNVRNDGANFDYGFKLKEEKDSPISDKTISLDDKDSIDMPTDDTFNMIVQAPWEEDIVWSSEDYKASKQSAIAQSRAGWIPSGNIRTMQAYLANVYRNAEKSSSQALSSAAILKNFSNDADIIAGRKLPSDEVSNWYSIFPVENKDLVYGKWEDKIIWDDEAMPRIPSPIMFCLDPNDENLILTMPSEPTLDSQSSEQDTTPKKDSKNRSKIGNKQKSDEEKQMLHQRCPPKDMFNLSNDIYYMPKQDLVENPLQIDLSSLTIQHSTPALELRRPFFPTYLSPSDLRHFHRPQIMKKKSNKPGLHVVQCLLRNIKKKAKEREKERQAFGGGEMFFMRTAEDLTGMDGELILTEYCEEWPPLLPQVGMNNRIRNYYRRKHGKDSGCPQLEYGETVYVHNSPFLGQLAPGQTLQAFENNMYRAPAYPHKMKPTDFLIIRSNDHYYVRFVNSIFTIGQECPKYEVPGPNSKKANNHMRDFLQIFIYRLFWKSNTNPRRIKMEDIRRAFPKHSESSVRKRLKLCADFRRTERKGTAIDVSAIEAKFSLK